MPTRAYHYGPMKISLHLLDDQYPAKPIVETRKVARVFAFNPEGKLAIHLVSRDDIFGKQSYRESPGGGVDAGESFEMAAIREAKEELGAKITLLEELGSCVDFYNLIGRKNENRFFLARIDGYPYVKHACSSGDTLISRTDYLTGEEALEAYQKMDDWGVSKLVKQRELPFLRQAIKRMGAYLRDKR